MRPIYNDELYHYGKMGMKWGHRKTHGKAPIMFTAKRQLRADKKVLKKMEEGTHHTSIGLTKKRQEAYDKRDKNILEKRIAKNTEKQSSTPKSSTKHEAAKWTSAAIASIGTKALADHLLLNQGIDGLPRMVASTLAGSLAGSKVHDLF